MKAITMGRFTIPRFIYQSLDVLFCLGILLAAFDPDMLGIEITGAARLGLILGVLINAKVLILLRNSRDS